MFLLTRHCLLVLVITCFPVCLSHAKSGVRPGLQSVKQQTTPPAASQASQSTEPLRTASDRKHDIRHIRLDLRVDVAKKTVVSQATIDFKTMRAAKTLNLDAVGFEVKKVMLSRDGQASSQAQYTHDGKKLVVELGNGMPAGQSGTVTVEYLVKQPRSGLHFFAPGKTNPEAPLQVWSQGQTVTNRYWIPCVDEPNQRQTTEVVVTVPAGYEAISNGKLVSRKENPADQTVTFDWLQDKPHPSYLITLVVGQFDVVQEDWNGIPVMYYVPKGKKAEALPTYGKTRDMMTYFSTRFGIPYPWDKYAQITAFQFGGGMENTSATTMGDFILKDERSLLDGNSEWIIAHELAHQWWGDLVTCRDWSHTWLNEGFASYAEALWDEKSKGKDDYAYNMYQKAATAINGGRSRPIMDRRYSNPDAMFDARAYPKGAWVLHMLRNRLGDEAFFNCLQKYGSEYKLQSAETGDFRRSIERTTGRDLERFFYDWLERPGHPELEVATEYKADEQKVHIVAKQTQKIEPFHFPLKIAIYCKGIADPVILEEDMKDRELKLSIAVPGALERVEVDPDQAVLATIKETKATELWRHQLMHGTTVPLRLRAVQQLKDSKDNADKDLLVNAYAQEKYHAVKSQLANLIGNARQPVGRDALLTGLGDTDARVRQNSVVNLAKFKDDEKVIATIRNIIEKGDPSYAVQVASLQAFAKMGQKDALTLLTPWLEKPSHRDVVASTALSAIADLVDPASLDTLLTWSSPGHPRQSRMRALRALQDLLKTNKLDSAQQQRILQSCQACLQEEDSVLHFPALAGLQQLGTAAKPALPAVEKFAAGLPDGNLKDTAKRVIEKIKAEPKKAEPTEAEKKKE